MIKRNNLPMKKNIFGHMMDTLQKQGIRKPFALPLEKNMIFHNDFFGPISLVIQPYLDQMGFLGDHKNLKKRLAKEKVLQADKEEEKNSAP